MWSILLRLARVGSAAAARGCASRPSHGQKRSGTWSATSFGRFFSAASVSTKWPSSNTVSGSRVKRHEQVGQRRGRGECVHHRRQLAVRAGEMRPLVDAVLLLVVEHEERVLRAHLLLVHVLGELGQPVQAVREQVGRLFQAHLTGDRVAGRLRQEEEAGPAPGRARLRLSRRLAQQLSHDRARAVAGDAVDDDELHVVLAAGEEVCVRVAGGSGDDEQVCALAGLDRAEVLVPAQDLGRVARRERDQVDVRQAAAVHAVDEPRHLQLAEQVLAPAGRPVRAERDQDSGVPRLAHVGGLAVEEQVAERRPDHRRRRPWRAPRSPSSGARRSGSRPASS